LEIPRNPQNRFSLGFIAGDVDPILYFFLVADAGIYRHTCRGRP
jgi:hypothetical protein